MLATEWGTGEVAWSMFWFFVVLGWFMLTIRVLWNVLRSTTLGGGAKALWVAAVLVFPFLGVFGYMESQATWPIPSEISNTRTWPHRATTPASDYPPRTQRGSDDSP